MTNASMNLLLVDTNILVYPHDPSDPMKQRLARELLDELVRLRRGAVSTQIIGEFFNALTRKISTELTLPQAETRALNTMLVFEVLDLTSSVVAEAVRCAVRNQMSYWDALIWATAKLNGIDTVLTEDIQSNGAVEGIRYINPFAAGFDVASL